jgi:hypothetical protein
MIHAAIRKNGDAFSSVSKPETMRVALQIVDIRAPPPASIVYTGTFASVRSDVA